MHGISILLSILGLLSVVMLIWMHQISKDLNMSFERCDALLDIQVKAASAHFELDEAILGDTSVDAQTVSREIDSAIHLALTVLNGGESGLGASLQPLHDSKLRQKIENIQSLLTEFKTIALQSIQEPRPVRIESAVNQRIHSVSKQIQDDAGALEILFEKMRIGDLTKAGCLTGV